MFQRHLVFIATGFTLLHSGCNGTGTPDTAGSSSSSGGSSVGPSSTDTASTDAPTTMVDATDTTTTTDTTTADATSTGGELVAKRVFITAASFNGDLEAQGGGAGGIDGADRLCMAAAAAASADGEWVAWVSSKDIDAGSRLAADGRWTLLDGATEVFPSKAAIQLGPKHAIDMTEAGDTLAFGGGGMVKVWTNTDKFGNNVTDGQNDACEDWTGQTGVAAVGTLFDPELGGPGLSWTDTKLPQACGDEYHLYCFEP